MRKQFIIKYKLFTMPYYYEFRAFAENAEKAIEQFMKEYPIGIEKFYIAIVFDV